MQVGHCNDPQDTAGAPRDEALLARITAGDTAAFALLYDRYAPMLVSVAQRILHCSAAAEDLTHDVCLEVYRQVHTYDPALGTVRTWLVMRIRSRALDRLKSASNTRRAAPDPIDELS